MLGFTKALSLLFSMKSNIDLLPSLQRVDERISSYTTTQHIVQGSAEGFIVEAQTSPNDETKHYFVKYVDIPKYSQKAWADLRRTIHYARTEIRFYNEILPMLRESLGEDWVIAPNVYLAEYDLEPLMNENESTADKSSNGIDSDPKYDENDTSALDGKYGILIMDNVKEVNGGFQQAPMRENIAIPSVEGLAKFHAAAFQKEDILKQVAGRLCEFGGSYHLKNRNPNELKNLVTTWKDFMTNIGPAAPPGFFDQPSIQALGQRLFDVAEYVADELSPSPSFPCATIVHGDYKAMNVFFTTSGKDEESNPSAILIDFASTGVGLGMSDLAMHVANVALPEDLDNGIEDVMVDKYFAALEKALPDYIEYNKEAALRHYRFATVDFCRYIIGRQWKGATLEVFKKRNKDSNFAMINRTPEAAIKFIERTAKYLESIEDEKNALSN